VLLIGPNGSGKTTLINCIAGTYKPDSGTILFNGKNVTGWQPYKLARIGLARTFQIPAPFKKLSVLENLLAASYDHPAMNIRKALFSNFWKEYENSLINRAEKVLRLTGLYDKYDSPANELSGGQLKLLELARLLMLDVKLLLLDEPIGGVNPTLAYTIFESIVKIKSEMKRSFLIIEHRLDIAMKYADYVYALAEGQIICEGLPEKVLKSEELYAIYL
jgi:branched-chain amino acid transport system ATP-binding protein